MVLILIFKSERAQVMCNWIFTESFKRRMWWKNELSVFLTWGYSIVLLWPPSCHLSVGMESLNLEEYISVNWFLMGILC